MSRISSVSVKGVEEFDFLKFRGSYETWLEQFKDKAIAKQVFCEKYGLSEKPIIALLPGSRSQEIEKKLPIMERFLLVTFALVQVMRQIWLMQRLT